jgi:hypothetical protein
MNTFLFSWNPTKWNWKTLEEDINTLKNTGYFTERWSVASHRKIKIGVRGF